MKEDNLSGKDKSFRDMLTLKHFNNYIHKLFST